MTKPYEELTSDEYRERYVPKSPDGKDWDDMSKEEKSIFIRQSVEFGYKKEYDIARSFRRVWDTTPEWEDLSEEQKENIRQATHKHAQEMQAFGASLKTDLTD